VTTPRPEIIVARELELLYYIDCIRGVFQIVLRGARGESHYPIGILGRCEGILREGARSRARPYLNGIAEEIEEESGEHPHTSMPLG